ncbi:MAG: Pvc16 family protein [Clostridium sp.]|nr:Pvc16 family protein [Acetatifactor muris]MCM1527182.1 Pvc16 family protein [Bacteroides sp.]MCM1562493.1 Pvc16 family protein [Clostridium sp.]
MDGIQDWSDGEILQTGKCLQEILRQYLCPEYVRDEDGILFTSPWDEEDYRVGIWLYDIQDHSPMAVEGAWLDETHRTFPPKATELSYMIFCNPRHGFGGLQRERVHGILNEILRAVYDNPTSERADGGSVGFSFLQESMDFKMQLWESFQKPLSPAVYVKAAPVTIASRRMREAHKVETREYGVRGREEP